MKKRDIETALRMARRLHTKLIEMCDHEECCDWDGCYFNDHICMDVDTVISNLEVYLNNEAVK